MRVMHVIASLAESGGAEMLVRNLSLEYARRGHQCHIAYLADAATLNASADYERGFMDQMDAAGIGYTLLGAGVRRNPLLGAWRLRRAVRRFRPDVLHVHLGWALLFQALGVVRVPTVYTHHNIVFKFSPRLFRLFDRFVGRYVAICEACRKLLAAHVRRPIALIFNGVPGDFADAGPRRGPDRDVSVLSVGNLTPQKDYPTLVAAARIGADALTADGRRATFRIAGEGAERSAIASAIAEAGLAGTVELLGARRDVPRLMAEADLLILSSRHEGLPITLIEAAMSALPAVATDVGGCREVVLDGATGLLAPPGDPRAIADAALAILTDPARRAAMSEWARERGLAFTLSACADAHLALYRELAR